MVTAKYREDARTICSNLKVNSIHWLHILNVPHFQVPQNSELRLKVIKREIMPYLLAQCDPLTLQSKMSKDSGKKILDESLQRFINK